MFLTFLRRYQMDTFYHFNKYRYIIILVHWIDYVYFSHSILRFLYINIIIFGSIFLDQIKILNLYSYVPTAGYNNIIWLYRSPRECGIKYPFLFVCINEPIKLCSYRSFGTAIPTLLFLFWELSKRYLSPWPWTSGNLRIVFNSHLCIIQSVDGIR